MAEIYVLIRIDNTVSVSISQVSRPSRPTNQKYKEWLSLKGTAHLRHMLTVLNVLKEERAKVLRSMLQQFTGVKSITTAFCPQLMEVSATGRAE